MQAVQVHVAETVEISQLQWKISLVQYMDRGSLFLSCRLSKCTSRRLHGQKVAVPVMQAVPSTRRGDSRDRTTAVNKFAGAVNGQRVAVPVMQAVPSTRRGDSRDRTTAVKKIAGAVNGQRVAVPVMQAVQVHVAETVEISQLQWKISLVQYMDRGSLFLSCRLSKCTSRRLHGQKVAVPVMQAVPSTRRGDSRDRTTAVKKFAGAVNGQRVAVPVMQAVQVHVAETVEISQLQWKISLVQYMDRGSLFLSCRLSKCTSRRLHGQKVAVPVMQAVPSTRRGDSRDRTTAVEDFAGAVNGQRVPVPVMQAVQMHVAETTWTEGRSSCHAGCPKYTSRRQSRSHHCSEKIRWCSKWTEGRCSCHAGCPSTRRGDSRDLTTAVEDFAGAVHGQRVAVPREEPLKGPLSNLRRRLQQLVSPGGSCGRAPRGCG